MARRHARNLDQEYNVMDRLGQHTLKARAIVEHWQKNTPAFVRQAIGVGSDDDDGYDIDPKQEEILKEFDMLVSAKQKRARGEKLSAKEEEYANKLGLSIRSGKGVGKTSSIAWIAMKFLSMFQGSKIIATAPKQDLLRDNLWGELARWKRYSSKLHGEKGFLYKNLVIQADKMYMKSDPKDWYMVARTCSRNASVADQKATLQGYHAPYLLTIVDEAWGVPDPVFEPLTTTLTQEVNIVILIGNPTKNYGYAHDTWGKFQEFFINIQINAEESTLVTPQHILTQKQIFKDSPNGYRVNVLGLPPLDDDDSVFPYWAIQEAIYRDLPEDLWIDEPTILVSDIGAGGDLTITSPFQGPKVHEFKSFSSSKADEVSRFIAQQYRIWGAIECGFDGIGIGWGVEPLLEQYGMNVTKIDARNKAFDDAKYFNLRSELLWELREDFITGNIDIPDDEELVAELLAIRLDGNNNASKIKILSKEKMKRLKLIQHSTNKADTLAFKKYYSREMVKHVEHEHHYSEDITENYRSRNGQEGGFMSV